MAPDPRPVQGWTFPARSYWGAVYNREMKLPMLEHAFRFVDNVVLVVGPRNMRSRKAIEKIGGVRVEGRTGERSRETRSSASQNRGTNPFGRTYLLSMRTSRMFFAFAALAIGAVALMADSKPDFTGTWKLNLDKSDLGGAPITALVVAVDHKDPSFKLTAKGTAGGEDFEETESFTTDGKPSEDSHGGTVKCHWDGMALVIEGTAPDGTPIENARLTISADGRTVTRDAVQKNDEGEQKRHEVYEKQ